MSTQLGVVSADGLVTDSISVAILEALSDGSVRSASELAYAARAATQVARSHLSKLLAGGLLRVEAQGRNRYYRLASVCAARALEHPDTDGSAAAVRIKPLSREARRLQSARCCYGHLAGRLGVAVTQALQDRGYLVAAEGKRFEVTSAGAVWFGGMGLNIATLRPTRYGLARQCLDWTERRHHLAGPLGVQFTALLCAKGWLRRQSDSRAVQVTPMGWAGLAEQLEIDADCFGSAVDSAPAD